MSKYFIIAEEKILLIENRLPEAADLDPTQLAHEFSLDAHYRCAIPCDNSLFHGEWVPLKQAYLLLGETVFQLAGRARQLLDWRLHHQFCGRCGSPTEFFDQGRAKKCPRCALTHYPRISPCVMVAVVREHEILLARSPHFPQALYSVLAGFIEPGETAETCVHREVYEEVGVKIHNIRYLASQSWPFPSQLMLGFIADYLSGDITIDGVEIEKAEWFRKDQLPDCPSPFSLAYHLIQEAVVK